MLMRSRSPAGIDECALGGSVLPETSSTLPAAPDRPPSRPRAGKWTRSKVAEMPNGMPSVLATSITWPSPPRYSPAPPESVRYSFFQTTSGARVSVISTATLRTPDGKAVALSPSALGLAPVPPEWNEVALNGVARASTAGSPSTRPGPPITRRFHRPDVPSAGTPSGSAWIRQPNTTSGSRWPITERAATGAGCLAFSTQPSGAVVRTVASEPQLLGTLGATMHLMPKLV